MSDWPPQTLYFNGARLTDEMHVSSTPFAGGTPYRLDAPPAAEQKYQCTHCDGSGYEPEPKGYCRTCGGYRAGPCEDCDNGQCTMNCGPAMVDVRGIFEAADAEYQAAEKHALVTPDEARAMRDAVRGVMVRLGLYELWQHCRKTEA